MLEIIFVQFDELLQRTGRFSSESSFEDDSLFTNPEPSDIVPGSEHSEFVSGSESPDFPGGFQPAVLSSSCQQQVVIFSSRFQPAGVSSGCVQEDELLHPISPGGFDSRCWLVAASKLSHWSVAKVTSQMTSEPSQ